MYFDFKVILPDGEGAVTVVGNSGRSITTFWISDSDSQMTLTSISCIDGKFNWDRSWYSLKLKI